jgi:hypothetical protein
MSYYPSQLPNTVSSVNGKSNAVTIESDDNSIVVDNSQAGKIKLSVLNPQPVTATTERDITNQPLILTNENGVTIMDTSPNSYGSITLKWGYVGLD